MGCTCEFDLDLATHVQQLLFPKSLPAGPWGCITVKNRMAQGLGGDFFDVITLPNGGQALFIGDVTGHGLHASVIMALLYGFIHHATHRNCSPLEIVAEVNNFLQSFAGRSAEYDHYFSATLFCGVLDPATLDMHYVNAGHPAPLVLRGGEITPLLPTAPPVGFFDRPEMAMGHFPLAAGDRCLFYTDGIIDAPIGGGALFGAANLQRVLRAGNGSGADFLDRLFDHFGTLPPHDDCTAIVVDLAAPLSGEG